MCLSHRFSFIACIFLLLLATGCKKYVAGPKGETGAPAPQGNLKSNVLYQTLDSTNWNYNNTNSRWESRIYVGDYNGKNVSSAEVKVFMDVDGAWWCLPYAEGEVFTQCSITGVSMLINQYQLHGTGPKPQKRKFRIVILTPA